MQRYAFWRWGSFMNSKPIGYKPLDPGSPRLRLALRVVCQLLVSLDLLCLFAAGLVKHLIGFMPQIGLNETGHPNQYVVCTQFPPPRIGFGVGNTPDESRLRNHLRESSEGKSTT